MHEAGETAVAAGGEAFRVLLIEDQPDHVILLREALEATGPGVVVEECRSAEISRDLLPADLTIVAPAASPRDLERALIDLAARTPDPRLLVLPDHADVDALAGRVAFRAVHTLSKRDGASCLEKLTGIVRELREAQAPPSPSDGRVAEAGLTPFGGVLPLAGVIARGLLDRLAAVDRAAEEVLQFAADLRAQPAFQRLRTAIQHSREALQPLRDLVCDPEFERAQATVPLPALLAARLAGWRAQLPASVTLSLIGTAVRGAPAVPARSFGLLLDELIRVLGTTHHGRITLEIPPRSPRRVLVTLEHAASNSAAELALALQRVAPLRTALEALGGTLMTPPVEPGEVALQFVIELSDPQRWPTATRPAHSGGSVLVISDDQLALARGALAPYGFAVAPAGSTSAAQSLVAAGCRYDFVLLGAGTQDGGGAEGVRALLARDPALQVVLVAAAGERPEALRAIAAGALGYFDDPLTVLDLAVLARAMGGESVGYRG